MLNTFFTLLDKRVNIMFRLLLAIFLVSMASPLYAAVRVCEADMKITPQITFPGVITVPPDVPVGTVIASGTSPGRADVYSDNGEILFHVNLYIEIQPSAMTIPSPTNGARLIQVLNTNIPGIGIAFDHVESKKNLLFIGTAYNSHSPFDFTIQYHLVKTSNSYHSGTLSGTYGSLSKSCFHDNAPGSSGYLPVGASLTVSGNPTVGTLPCQVTDTDINVPMGSITQNSFTGPGKIVAPRQFNIPLSCDADAGANVYFTVVPSASGSSDILNGILNLDNSADSSTAQGIGLQILFNNTPLKLNQSTSAGKTRTQNFVIPLQAQYIQTASETTAGAANASATFLISYN